MLGARRRARRRPASRPSRTPPPSDEPAHAASRPRRSWRLMGASLSTGRLGRRGRGRGRGRRRGGDADHRLRADPGRSGAGEPGRPAVAHAADGARHDGSLGGFKTPSGSETLPFGDAELDLVRDGPGRWPRSRTPRRRPGCPSRSRRRSRTGWLGSIGTRWCRRSRPRSRFGAGAGSGLVGQLARGEPRPGDRRLLRRRDDARRRRPARRSSRSPSRWRPRPARRRARSRTSCSPSPGVPADLADEIRLLGNLQTTLPIPTPPGMTLGRRPRSTGSPARGAGR